jgi:hypothetical protein
MNAKADQPRRMIEVMSNDSVGDQEIPPPMIEVPE